MRRLLLSVLLVSGLTAAVPAQDVKLPMKDGSLHFAIIGDSGTGDREQYAVAQQLANFRARFPFDFAIMVGDNVYGTDSPSSFLKKFERPYKPLLDAGVKFYASLGNHDDPANQQNYKPFNMGGQRYYSFKPKDGVRFFALDSNYMDQKQLQWFEKELQASGSDWKIAFFHHPPYSSGMHGSNLELRQQLEPMFLKYGVTVAFTGHEHFYERIKPQKGIQYFVIGNSAKLRKGDLNPSNITAKGYDTGYGFMLAEVAGDELYFQTISDKGVTIDSGVIKKMAKEETISGRPEVTTTGTGGIAKPGPTSNEKPDKPAAPAKPAPAPAPAKK
jgi:hypothetical protein